MFKILLVLLLMITPSWAAQWRNGTGENTLLGSSQAALIGTNTFNSIVQPLDNYISNKCDEYLQYLSSSTMTVVSGTCVVSNSQGTIRLILQDTSNTVITSSNLDTGSLVANTTYYVYATAATSSSTTSTYYISASNLAPSGQTYYYQIGSFSTDSNSWFTGIINNKWNSYINGTYQSKTCNVIYQALTDLDLYVSCGNALFGCNLLSDSSNPPTQNWASIGSGSGNTNGTWPAFMRVRKGDYYETTTSGSIAGCTMGIRSSGI